MRYEVYAAGNVVLVALNAPSPIGEVDRVRAELELVSHDATSALRMAEAVLRKRRAASRRPGLEFERY